MVNEDPVVGASGAIAITIQGVAVAGHLIGGPLSYSFPPIGRNHRRQVFVGDVLAKLDRNGGV